MTSTILVLAIVPVAIVLVGSCRYWAAWVVVIVCAALGVVVAVRDLALIAGLPFYPWHGPVLASYAVIVLGVLTAHVALRIDQTVRIGAIAGRLVAEIGRMFTDSRRRSSVRADVRRAVKQYRIEVES